MVLHRAFPDHVADAVREVLGALLGIDLADEWTWGARRLWLRENLGQSPFVDALTARFRDAVDQLVGVDRWVLRNEIGWWPVTFPGYDGGEDDWHVEGQSLHEPWSCEQAVLPLFCFSPVSPGGGGTRLAVGSHHVVARELWTARRALDGPDLIASTRRRLDQQGWDIWDVVADAGDVVLAHPLLVHSGAPNHGTRPRIMAQPRYDLRETKHLGDGHLSATELPIAQQRPAGRSARHPSMHPSSAIP